MTGEKLQTFLNGMPVGDAFRHDIMRALRMVYAFGVDQNYVRANPTRKLKAPAQAHLRPSSLDDGMFRRPQGGGGSGETRILP